MIADFLAGLNIKQSVALFQAAICCLVEADVFPSGLTLILDGTDVETTSKCVGAGGTVRKKKTIDKKGRTKSVEVVVHGFKAVVAFELTTQIPVGLIVTKIQRNETGAAKRLIKQVQETFEGSSSRITKVLEDRGFLDGKTLWWLHRQEISFVVPARSDMLITKAARLEADDGHGIEQRRIDKHVHGRGKKRWVEEKETLVVGVEDLRFLDSFNDPAQAALAHRRGYQPEPLQAVVIRSWQGHRHDTGEEPVLLTNMSVKKPLSIQSDYRNRSLIENTLFREGKQAWTLENIPQKNQKAAVAHIAITLMMVALTTAYRGHWERAEEDEQIETHPSSTLAECLGAPVDPTPVGIRRWRRRLHKQNKDYVIVFEEGTYAVFHVAEFSVLGGFRIKNLPEHLGNREAIFARYGLAPP